MIEGKVDPEYILKAYFHGLMGAQPGMRFHGSNSIMLRIKVIALSKFFTHIYG